MKKLRATLIIFGLLFIVTGVFDLAHLLKVEQVEAKVQTIAEEDVISFGDFGADDPSEPESAEDDSFSGDDEGEVDSDNTQEDSKDSNLAKINFEGVGSVSVNVDVYCITCGILLLLIFLLSFFVKIEKFKKMIFVLMGFMFFVAVLSLAAKGSEVAVIGILAQSLRLATPIILGAMVGIICEKSGVINIGIEGTMLTGACFGFLGTLYSGNPFVGVFVAMLSGVAISFFHALLSITYRCDQIISGTFVNILAVGMTGFLRAKYIVGEATVINLLPTIKVPILHAIPLIGPLVFINKPIVFFMLFFVFTLYFLLNYTSYGLKTRALGEHPEAADTVGIFVNRMRYINVMFAGSIAGIAGAWFSVETTGSFDDLMTNGKGFIALAAMIFGRYHPVSVFWGALLFGFADAVQIKLQIARPDIPYQFLSMVPYIITMVVLAGIIGKAYPPKSVGKPYFK
jgi:simple sugar transport system permease protein